MDDRAGYPSDLPERQWAPFLQAWKAKRPSPSGYEGRYDLWMYLPPWSAVYYYLALWPDDGTDQAVHDLLRCQARERAGRAEDPTAVVLDTQSVGRLHRAAKGTVLIALLEAVTVEASVRALRSGAVSDVRGMPQHGCLLTVQFVLRC